MSPGALAGGSRHPISSTTHPQTLGEKTRRSLPQKKEHEEKQQLTFDNALIAGRPCLAPRVPHLPPPPSPNRPTARTFVRHGASRTLTRPGAAGTLHPRGVYRTLTDGRAVATSVLRPSSSAARLRGRSYAMEPAVRVYVPALPIHHVPLRLHPAHRLADHFRARDKAHFIFDVIPVD